jgi:predicted metal-dependent hydrolase
VQQEIILKNQLVLYDITKSKRAKKLRISISPSGNLKVTLPWYIPKIAATHFIKSNQDWILTKLAYHTKNPPAPEHTLAQITELKIETRTKVRQKISIFNQHYNFKFNRITIRNQKTRWGSCSSNLTLSFNYKLALLPEKLLEYVVVHELCHLKEMNHSSKFWNLVAQTMPNHKSLRRQLHATKV